MSYKPEIKPISAESIAEYISFLEKRIKELAETNSKLSYDNSILKDAIVIIKDVDLSKLEGPNWR